jgi:hypothetical protein
MSLKRGMDAESRSYMTGMLTLTHQHGCVSRDFEAINVTLIGPGRVHSDSFTCFGRRQIPHAYRL